jgi:hypothetical protein
MTTTNAASIRVIWDYDHGTDNEGWYVRTLAENGSECDTPISGPRPRNGTLSRRAEQSLRAEARRVARRDGLRPTRIPVSITF